MKKTIILTSIVALTTSLSAQVNNLVMDGSFENVPKKIHNTGWRDQL